eukprot:g13491.t1
MVRFRWRFGLLCLVRAVGSAGMPVAEFVRSMFEIHGADTEGYEDHSSPQVEGEPEGPGNSVLQRDFVLNDELYAAFNRLGQEQYQIIQHQGLDSACWRHAAISINADCATMEHSRKQRLAVLLSNCHLQDAGRAETRCSPEDSDDRCVKELQNNNVAFQSYTQFFHHVLEGQERASAQTQGIADGLADTREKLTGLSDSLSQELESAMKEIEKQESLLASLMAAQAIAAAQASSFSAELDSAKSELASYMQAIEEERRVAKDQNMDLMKTIDFIHDCLDSASSAWARFQAFTYGTIKHIYLILATNLCWVLTTIPPLRSARTALFSLVAFGLMLEKSLCGNGGLEGPVAIFNQEKIRWLTFQAGAAILGHALVSHYVPCLEFGRLVGSLMRKNGFARRNIGSQPGRQRPLRLLTGGGRERGAGGDGGDRGRATTAEPMGGRRGSYGGRPCSGGASARRGRGNAGTRAPPLPPINRVGEESGSEGCDESEHNKYTGGDSDAFGVREGEKYGGRGSASGRGWVRGNTRADGLERLTRQELQSLAKATNGAVRANLSTGDIRKGLRDLGITANACSP